MVLLIRRSVLIIVEIHHLSPSIITLKSIKTSQSSLSAVVGAGEGGGHARGHPPRSRARAAEGPRVLLLPVHLGHPARGDDGRRSAVGGGGAGEEMWDWLEGSIWVLALDG